MTLNLTSQIIIACDFSNSKQLFIFLKKFKKQKLFLKLGMQIIYNSGFKIIKKLQKMGHKIFLDLKLFDIPTTVEKSLNSLKKYQVDFITIHALGGLEMLQRAQETLKNSKTKLLAVTILTSANNQTLKEMNISKNMKSTIENLMILAKKANIYGVVCSGLEANLAQKHNLAAITPGIRLNPKNIHDQKRVLSPQEAIKNGAKYLVIGREITNNSHPLNIYSKIKEEISFKN